MNRKSWIPNYSVPLWAQRSKYYLMEFIAALLGLLVTAFLLDKVLFSLARYLSDSQVSSSAYDEMNVWAVAMLLVSLPVALLFYKRSRFEELGRPAVAATKLRRFFLYTFMLITLVAMVAFAINAVYSVLLVLYGAAETEALLQRSLPALLAALLHAYIFRTFMKVNSEPQIKEFAFMYGVLGAVLLIAMLVMTSIQARSSLVDEKTSKDLQKISQAIDSYYNEKGTLPDGLRDLSLENSLTKRGEKYAYTYEKRTAFNYKLCADFKAKGEGKKQDAPELLKARTAIYPPLPSDDDFYSHGKGKHCFDVSAGGRVYPAEDSYQSVESPKMPAVDDLLNSAGDAQAY